MRILVLDEYYGVFLAAHYAANPGLARRPYDEQLASLMGAHFGTGDAYSHNLAAAGNPSTDVVVNCVPLQRAWAAENGGAVLHALSAPGRLGRLPRPLLRRVLDAQIAAFEPDVVYAQDLRFLGRARCDALRERGVRVVGQLASIPPPDDVLRGYELIVSSLPSLVERLRAGGVEAEYLPIAFDDRVLTQLEAEGLRPRGQDDRSLGASFVGTVHPPQVHRGGTELLERVCRETDMQVWGPVADRVDARSAIRGRHQGEAWGLDMYRVLARSRIAFNRHGDVAEGYANNMRLFEATGLGALLLTEAAPNLTDLFEPGREVVAYTDADDLIEKLRHYLSHEDERRRIAAAGQARTLKEHTYARRIPQLLEILG